MEEGGEGGEGGAEKAMRRERRAGVREGSEGLGSGERNGDRNGNGHTLQMLKWALKCHQEIIRK